jgi:hypothetical protein
MSSAVRELEVIACASQPKHDTVKSFVILEAADNAKTKPVAIHRLSSRQVANRAGNSEVRRHWLHVAQWSSGLTTILGDLTTATDARRDAASENPLRKHIVARTNTNYPGSRGQGYSRRDRSGKSACSRSPPVGMRYGEAVCLLPPSSRQRGKQQPIPGLRYDSACNIPRRWSD